MIAWQLYIGNGLFVLVDEEDYQRVAKYKWHVHNGRTGGPYARAQIKQSCGKYKAKLLHRIILDINDPKIIIDHINGDGLDNRKENLRIATRSQNYMNRKVTKRNSTGIKGVFWNKRDKLYYAVIRINKKSKHLGCFENKEEAKMAYESAAKEIFGEFYPSRLK